MGYGHLMLFFKINIHRSYCYTLFSDRISIKHTARDVCLYLGETGETVGPPALPAPAFSIAYSSATTGGFSSNLTHVCSSPGKNF